MFLVVLKARNKDQPESSIAPLVGDESASQVAKSARERGQQESVPDGGGGDYQVGGDCGGHVGNDGEDNHHIGDDSGDHIGNDSVGDYAGCSDCNQESVPSPNLVRENPKDEAARQQADHEERVDGWRPDILAAVLNNKQWMLCKFHFDENSYHVVLCSH